MLDIASLTAIKATLQVFGNISGLKCNYEKSVIVPINYALPELIREIEGLGFTVANNFKLSSLKPLSYFVFDHLGGMK